MSFWDELGIEATKDKKLIKRAYAKRLKLTRPEDNIEAFQALYTAYQRALSYAEYPREQTEEEDDEPSFCEFALQEVAPQCETELVISPTPPCPKLVNLIKPSQDHELIELTTPVLPPPLPISHSDTEVIQTSIVPTLESPIETPSEQELTAAPTYALLSTEQQLEQEWQHTEKWLEQLLANPQEANVLSNWGFLKRSPLLQDLEWRIKVSTYVFEKIASANYSTLNKTELPVGTLYIKTPILTYLDNLLGWERSWQYLRSIFPEVYLDAVFNYLTITVDKKVSNTAVEEGSQLDKSLTFFKWISKSIRVILAFYINAVIAVSLVGVSMDLSPLVALVVFIFILYTYMTGGRFIKWITFGHTLMGLTYGDGK